MDLERTIETQRLKLLRIVAGLVVLVGFLSVGPISRGFSISLRGFVGSILSRAEAAAQYLVIGQARLIIAGSSNDGDQNRFSETLARVLVADETDVSLPECRERLKALRAVLMDLPRHAARLLRRIEKRMRRTAGADRISPHPVERLSASLRDWHLATIRIERPPDKTRPTSLIILPPPEPRAGGAGRWSDLPSQHFRRTARDF